MNFSINIVDNINSNSGTVTVTKKTPYVLSTTTKQGGFKNEQKKYIIKGSTTSKSRVTIATIKFEVGDNKEFSASPSLSSSNNIKLVLNNIERKTASNGRKYVNSYLFNLVYYNTVSTSPQDDISANLIYKDLARPTITTLAYTSVKNINNIIYGKTILSRSGEERKITVIGVPGSTATLTVKDDNGDSILIDNAELYVARSTSKIVDSHSCTIGASGRYSFNQKFPSIISKGTALNDGRAASGGSANVTFDDLTGVKVGDKVMLSSSSDETASTVVTVLNPNGNNTNECTISPNLTAADNARVMFKRSRKYYINIETSSGLGSKIPTVSPTYTLCQYRDPILTLKAEGNTAYTITQFDGVATSLGSGAAHYWEKRYAGIAGFTREQTERFSRVKETINFTYLLTASGGKNFTGFTAPTFNRVIIPERAANKNKTSHWTNSVASQNGGTDVSITAIATSDLNETTLTVSGTININKWGIEDVTMALDFNEILTYSS